MGVFAKIKNVISKIPVNAGQRTCLNVCMMGPRAVGKTTILTSIFHDSDKAFSSSKLKFVPKGDTKDVLSKGRKELDDIFQNYKGDDDTPQSGIKASNSITRFHFEMGIKGKEACADVNIVDFPGEFVDENHLEHSKVEEFIKTSHMILVAVDSVFLMEDGGKYNEIRNRSNYICEKICSLLKHIDQTERKLILFVPLKCEKYCVEGRIDDVTNEVIRKYSLLLTEIMNNYKDRIGIAITPIQTLGGVIFDKFTCSLEGKLEYDEDGVTPKVKFKFYPQMKGHKAMYLPSYCVQPLYYLIAFVVSQHKNNKEKGGFLGILFKGISGLFSSNIEFYEASQAFAKYIKTEGNGYKIINNPNFFNR